MDIQTVSKENLERHLVKYCEDIGNGNQSLYLDDGRRQFIHQFSDDVCNFIHGKFEGSTGHGKLLHGLEAIGKTHLMISLLNGLRQINLKNNLHIISTNCDEVLAMEKSLSQIIYENLHDPNSITHTNIIKILELLRNNGIKIIIFIDELQVAFSKKDKLYECILSEIKIMGNNSEGLIYAILTGTSCDLPRLCFKMRNLIKNNFRYKNIVETYAGFNPAFDLNGTKFQIYRIYPMLISDDFEGIKSKLNTVKDASFVTTNGIPRIIKTGGTPSLFLRLHTYMGNDGFEKKYFKALIQILDSNGEMDIFSLCKPIEYNRFARELSDTYNSLVPFADIIQDLEDEGYIKTDKSNHLISLICPQVYFYYKRSSTFELSKQQQFSLMIPTNVIIDEKNKDIAERLAMSLLSFSSFDSYEHNLITFQPSKQFPQQIEGLRVKENIPYKLNILYKENDEQGKDSLGADAVILTKENVTIVVHRIQIKLHNFSENKTNNVSNTNAVNDTIEGFHKNGREQKVMKSYKLLLTTDLFVIKNIY